MYDFPHKIKIYWESLTSLHRFADKDIPSSVKMTIRRTHQNGENVTLSWTVRKVWTHFSQKVASSNFSILMTKVGDKNNKQLLKVFLMVNSHAAWQRVILIDDAIDALHGNQCMDLLRMFCALPPLTVADPGFWSKTTKKNDWGVPLANS